MEYFFSTQLENNKIILSKEESVHCLRVLRYRIGDKIYVTDGRGNQFFCKIDNIDNDIVKSTITDTKTTVKKSHIHIVISPTKSRQRLEWFIEKSIEIGVDEISFIECLNSERTKIN